MTVRHTLTLVNWFFQFPLLFFLLLESIYYVVIYLQPYSQVEFINSEPAQRFIVDGWTLTVPRSAQKIQNKSAVFLGRNQVKLIKINY